MLEGTAEDTVLRKLSSMLAKAMQNLEAIQSPRVSVAWQDLDMIYRRVHNPSPDIGTNIIGKRLEDILPDKEQARRMNEIKRTVIKTGKPYHDNIQMSFGNGLHYYELTIEPTFAPDGTIDGLTSVTIEVTDLIEAKQQLAEANARLMQILEDTLDAQPRPSLRGNRAN